MRHFLTDAAHFVSAQIPEDAKKRLLELTPASYIGEAAKIARQC
jgi:hypothetical protein